MMTRRARPLMRWSVLLLWIPVMLVAESACSGTPQVVEVPQTVEVTRIVPVTAVVTPTVEATVAPAGIPDPPTREVDPHVEISVSATTVRVGERFTVVGVAHDIGQAWFTLHIYREVMEVRPPAAMEGPGNEADVRVVSAQAAYSQVEFLLEALEPGIVEVRVSATGEIHYGYPGPATWGAGSSGLVRIQVVDE